MVLTTSQMSHGHHPARARCCCTRRPRQVGGAGSRVCHRGRDHPEDCITQDEEDAAMENAEPGNEAAAKTSGMTIPEPRVSRWLADRPPQSEAPLVRPSQFLKPNRRLGECQKCTLLSRRRGSRRRYKCPQKRRASALRNRPSSMCKGQPPAEFCRLKLAVRVHTLPR